MEKLDRLEKDYQSVLAAQRMFDVNSDMFKAFQPILDSLIVKIINLKGN